MGCLGNRCPIRTGSHPLASEEMAEGDLPGPSSTTPREHAAWEPILMGNRHPIRSSNQAAHTLGGEQGASEAHSAPLPYFSLQIGTLWAIFFIARVLTGWIRVTLS